MGKRILVEGIMHLGDLIASSAIIGPLKREYPDSHITYLITPGMETAIESMPQVDDYIVYRYKSGGDIKGVWELSRKMKRGNYTLDELEEIARATGTKTVCYFELPNGEIINLL